MSNNSDTHVLPSHIWDSIPLNDLKGCMRPLFESVAKGFPPLVEDYMGTQAQPQSILRAAPICHVIYAGQW